MRRKGMTYCWLLCMLAGFLCCGCTEEEDVFSETSTSETLDLKVTLTIDKNALRGNTRAETGSEFKGTDGESTIHSLTLFVANIENGQETIEDHQTVTNPNINGLIKFDLTGTKGTKRFYLGANMNDQHIAAVTGDKSVYTLESNDLSTGYANTHQLMDIDYANQGQGSNILMTARIKSGGKQEIKVETGEIRIDSPVLLERVVSKVLLTCKTTNEGNVAVKNDVGWVKLANVRYMGDLFNRKLYIFPQADATKGGLMDSNYEISQFIEDKQGYYIIKDKANYIENFLTYDIYQQSQKLKDINCKTYHKAVRYEATRLETSNANRYTEGLFYPENRVKKDMNFSTATNLTSEQTFAVINRFVSTHLLVAVKFVPKTIWAYADGYLKSLTETSDQTMLDNHLTGQTETIAGSTKTYEQGTFWYYDSQFYTLKGMLQFLNEHKNVSRAEMERFDGGWGYYYTFIDGTANNGVIDYKNMDTWGLTRNHYYILNITSIIPPGSSVPGDRVMMIPTQKLDWIDKGGSDITVIP